MPPQIDVHLVTVVPPAPPSINYSAKCTITNYVDEYCNITASMILYSNRDINIFLPKDYFFVAPVFCVDKVGACDSIRSIWQFTGGGAASNKIIVHAKHDSKDLEYSLYVINKNYPSHTIKIDPMIRNGIKPIMEVFAILVLLGLVVFSVLRFNNLRRARRSRN